MFNSIHDALYHAEYVVTHMDVVQSIGVYALVGIMFVSLILGVFMAKYGPERALDQVLMLREFALFAYIFRLALDFFLGWHSFYASVFTNVFLLISAILVVIMFVREHYLWHPPNEPRDNAMRKREQAVIRREKALTKIMNGTLIRIRNVNKK